VNLISTTLFSAITSIVRVMTGFLSGKILSVILGPSGVAQIGAFTNLMSMVYSFSNAGITNGVIKYSAEFKNEQTYLRRLTGTAARISLMFSGTLSLLLVSFPKAISDLFFNKDIYVLPIRVLGIFLTFFSLNSLMVAILNGRGNIRMLTIVNVTGALLGLGLTVTMVSLFHLKGALLSLATSQAIVFVFTAFIFFKNCNDVPLRFFFASVDKDLLLKLSNFSLMTLVSAICVPVSQLLIRKSIIHYVDIEGAGYWQAVIRISEGMLMIITMAMSTYYLPRFASLSSKYEIRKEIVIGVKFILPLVAVIATFVFIFRIEILVLLFSDKFLKAESLFLWQLVGDIFKIANWILGYFMLAKAMTKYYILAEILFTSLLVILTWYFLLNFGIKGVTYAYALNNVIALLVLSAMVRKGLD